MKIGELARRTGLAPSRIRFYEREGLLQMVERTANGYRAYPEDAVLVLGLITAAQEAGFSLEELRRLLPANLTDWDHETLVQALRDKVQSLEVLLQRLERSKATILQVLEQIEEKPSDMACETNARRVLSTLDLSPSAPNSRSQSPTPQSAKHKLE